MMKLLTIFAFFLGAIAEQPFIQMNSECYITWKTLYACSDINTIIDYDPEKTLDINYICNRTICGQFNNQQFADRINYRFNAEGFNECNVSVINNLDKVQLKNQCPVVVEEYCK